MSAACLVLTDIITKIRCHIIITECPWAKFQGTLTGGGVRGGFPFRVCGRNSMVGIVQKRATDLYFPVVISTILCKVVSTFEAVNEILKCYHSNKSF